ncbi:MAG: hypothetical protein IH795_02890, partial [Bacteroidetes bacterium]|nr:hypothetical protein [Bacteroidota bacterium]
DVRIIIIADDDIFRLSSTGTPLQPGYYVFSMELIKATRSILLLLFLILFSAGALAQLDPEIIKQIGFSEALLNKNEKIIHVISYVLKLRGCGSGSDSDDDLGILFRF